MKVLNLLAAIGVCIGMVGWVKKISDERLEDDLVLFRANGVQTNAQVLSRENRVTWSRRGTRRHSYSYSIQYTLPDGRKVSARLPAPDQAYLPERFPFPKQIWYLPDRPERVMEVASVTAVENPKDGQLASMLMIVGGCSGLYLIVVGSLFVRRVLKFLT